MADEDTPAARRIAGAGDVVGSADRDAVDCRLRAAAAHARAQGRFVPRVGSLHEGNAYELRTGLQRERELERPGGRAAPTTGASTAPTRRTRTSRTRRTSRARV